jgi:hypothetical protein
MERVAATPLHAVYTARARLKNGGARPGPEGGVSRLPPSRHARFLTIGLKGDERELPLWPGANGHPIEGTAAPPLSIPGPLFIQSDDLRKDAATLRSRGVKLLEAEPEDYTWGVRATALNPDGNRPALRQPKRRAT